MKKLYFILASTILFAITHTALAFETVALQPPQAERNVPFETAAARPPQGERNTSCPSVDEVKAVNFRVVCKLNGRWEFTSNRFESNGRVWLVHFSTRLDVPTENSAQALQAAKTQFDNLTFYNPPHVRNPENNITCVYGENLIFSVVATPSAIY